MSAPSEGAAGAAQSYDLFRRLDAPELACAVRRGAEPPAFLSAGRWAPAGEANEAAPPPGFDVRAAGLVSRWMGFYVFESWTAPSRRAA